MLLKCNFADINTNLEKLISHIPATYNVPKYPVCVSSALYRKNSGISKGAWEGRVSWSASRQQLQTDWWGLRVSQVI